MESILTGFLATGIFILIGYVVYKVGYHSGYADGVRAPEREFYIRKKDGTE